MMLTCVTIYIYPRITSTYVMTYVHVKNMCSESSETGGRAHRTGALFHTTRAQ